MKYLQYLNLFIAGIIFKGGVSADDYKFIIISLVMFISIVYWLQSNNK